MTEYKSLESRIREVAMASMQKKFDEAKVRYTTKTVMEETQPEPEVIKEEAEPVEEISKEKLEKYVKAAVTSHGAANFAKQQTTNPDEKAAFGKAVAKRKKGISTAINKLDKKEEVEPIEELAPAIDPMKAKMDAQRQQVQKQRDQFKMQLQKQKAAKQMQSDKAKGEKELEKIKEDDLDERQVMRVRTFGRASKLQQLHNRQYSRLMASGNLAKAEMHRKRSIEYKRVMYQAKDNPDRLPSI